MRVDPGRPLVAVTCALLLFLVGGLTSASAQAIHDGKITGTVVGEDGAVIPGAMVEISGPALVEGRRATVTSATGTYVFLSVPVGRYRVVASLPGFKTMLRDNMDVSADATVTADFTLPVGGIEELVTVTAAAPVVDAKTSTTDTKIDQELLARLPTSRDAFYDLALTAPGMFDSSSTWTQPSPTAYGSATNENVFLINGVDATNPRAGTFGSLVKVNYDAVEEVRIVALGSKAEYGSFSGGAVDVLTKSGSNSFHGSGAFYSLLGSPASNQPGVGDDLGEPWLFVGAGEQLSGETNKDWEVSGVLGGPIARDKAWFFGAFDYLRTATLPPRWSLENEYWGRYADGKVSVAPLTNHRAWAAYHYENNDGTGWSWGTEPAWDTSMTYGVATLNHTVSSQWQWFPTGTTLATAKYLGFWTDDRPNVPENAPDHPGYINWWKWSTYGINGAFPYVEAQKSNRQTVQADLSHFTEAFLGQHDMKFGVQYTKGRGNWQGGYFQNYVNFLYPYRWTQSVANMQSWYGDTGLLFYNNKDTLNPFLTVRTADSFGAFFDDQWAVNKRLTLNVGFRFDRMATKYGAGEVYDFVSSPEEINDPPPVIRGRESTDNIFDFKTFAPRLGLSWSVTEDRRTVARASWGRYYQPLNVEYLRRFGPDMPMISRSVEMYNVGPWSSVDTNGDGFVDTLETRDAARRVHGLTPFRTTSQTRDPSWSLNVADDLKDQYTDQLTFNLEREIARNVAISGSYIFKHAGDMFANIPINRVTGQEWEYERVPFRTSAGQDVMLYSIAFRDYNGDGALDGSDVQWVKNNSTFRVQNMPSYDGIKPKRDYHGFQFVLNKKLSDRWQALGSILYSRSDGMANRIRQAFNAEGPMFTDDNWMGTLNYTVNNLDAPLPFTPRWEFKLSGSYLVPRVEMDVAARFRMHTGRPVWQLESYPQHTQWASPDGGVIDAGGVGSIVAGNATDPDYLPTRSLLDLRLEKAIPLGNGQTVQLMVDGFNVFNTNAPTAIDYQFEYGKVTAIPTSRRFRIGLRYQF